MGKQRRLNHPKLMWREEGVVLIAVLWICALVMWFTLQVGALVRLQGEDQVHLFRRAQAHYLAIGGCFEALARMGQPPPSGLERGPDLSWQPDGTEHLLQYQTGEVVVSIASEMTKVNVNLSTPEQLREVLIAAGMHEYNAEELADVIADFVDPDDLKRLHGMEGRDYKRQDLPYGPFNGPLLTLDQLLLIPGLSEQLLYGYATGGESPADRPSSMVPRKDSLFEMLSIYGTNTALPNLDLEEELEGRIISWQSGGIYRIYSTGMAHNGPPAVTICLFVRFAPETKHGYEILARKIM